jgi:hypothetical protein
MTEGEKVKLQAWVEKYTDDMLVRASLRWWELRTGAVSMAILDERIRRVLMAKGRDAAKLPAR